MASNMSKEEARLRLLLRGIDPEKTPVRGETAPLSQIPAAAQLLQQNNRTGDIPGGPASPEITAARKATFQRIAPHVAGALGAATASVLTGGGALPALIAGGLGGTSSTSGQAAASTALSAVPFKALTGAGGKLAQLLRGGATGAGSGALGEVIQHGVDNQRLPTPTETGTAAGIGGVLGGLPAAASSILSNPKLTPYKQYLSDLTEHKATGNQLEKQQILADSAHKTAGDTRAVALDKSKDATIEAQKAANAVKAAQSEGKNAAQKRVLATQAQYAADIESARSDLRGAKDTADSHLDTIKSHVADMDAKAKDFKTQRAGENKYQAADLKDQAADKANALARLNLVQRDEAGPIGRMVAPENVPDKKLELVVSKNNLNNAAAKARQGIDNPTFQHSQEDVAKLAEHQTAYGDALDKVDDVQRKIEALKVAQAQHKAAAAASTPLSMIDDGLLKTHDAASTKAQDAMDELRQAKKAEMDAKKAADAAATDFKLHKANAPVEVKPSTMDRVHDIIGNHTGAGAISGGIAEEIARHLGLGSLSAPIGLGVGGAASSVLSSPGAQAAKQAVLNLLQKSPSMLSAVPQASDVVQSGVSGVGNMLAPQSQQ